MIKKKICFIAQFPPPIHGLSKAVDTLYRSNLVNEFDLEKVDLTDNKRFLKTLLKIWKSKADLFYFTISQTKGGNLRDLIILKMLEWKKRKCLVHLHGGYYRKLVDDVLPGWQQRMNYKAIKNLSGVIVLSPSLKSIFNGMIEDEKIFVVPNCIDDVYLMSDTEFEEKITALRHKKVLHVLYLSNFIKSKGYPEVLKMAKLEKERVAAGLKKRFHFNFAGSFFEDGDREFFNSYIKENQLQDFITFHGIVDGHQKKELLMKCDIFILLTRYPNEGQPISILEAMGNGMVILTTDHAGIPDIIVSGINGIVVLREMDAVEHIYNDLSKLQDKFSEIMRINRTESLAKYSETKYVENLINVFKTIEERIH